MLRKISVNLTGRQKLPSPTVVKGLKLYIQKIVAIITAFKL